ncbi:hypothetical protein ACF0H5_022333 [Mactra antiquata]
MESVLTAFMIIIDLIIVNNFPVVAFDTKNIRFSKRLDEFSRSTFYKGPLKKCWTACKERTYYDDNDDDDDDDDNNDGDDNDDDGDDNDDDGDDDDDGFRLKCDPLVIDNGYVKGNMLEIGSKVKLGCNEGFMSTNGPNVEVISECSVTGLFESITCFPVTCLKVAESSFTNKFSSASYKSFDLTTGQVIDVFCDFDTETTLGYTYFSKSTLRHVTSLANHYNVHDHVVVRHFDTDVKEQYSSKLQMMSTYQAQYPNVSVFLSSHVGFTSPTNSDGVYIYVGFVPGVVNGDHLNDNSYGYSCNGVDKKFTNCDGNPNNYFVVYENGDGSVQKANCCAHGIAVAWKDCKQSIVAQRRMAQEYFYDRYEMHMGGCGTLSISNMDGVQAVAFGLPFDY